MKQCVSRDTIAFSHRNIIIIIIFQICIQYKTNIPMYRRRKELRTFSFVGCRGAWSQIRGWSGEHAWPQGGAARETSDRVSLLQEIHLDQWDFTIYPPKVSSIQLAANPLGYFLCVGSKGDLIMMTNGQLMCCTDGALTDVLGCQALNVCGCVEVEVEDSWHVKAKADLQWELCLWFHVTSVSNIWLHFSYCWFQEKEQCKKSI